VTAAIWNTSHGLVLRSRRFVTRPSVLTAELFLRAAASHGIQRRTLLYRYALRAAANPLISLLDLAWEHS